MNFIRNLKVFQAIASDKRNSAVDFARSLAILAVVMVHFHKYLPYGHIGVDLFFVISGLLIGGILHNQFQKEQKISFPKFFIQRAFKILPSYYFFIFVGNLIVWLLYSEKTPEYVIPSNDYWRYIFFYFNYTGVGLSVFYHIWSLCVEEHFYIMLPFVFIIAQYFSNKRFILFCIIMMILVGIAGKYASYAFLKSQESYAGTHNRIDALGYGVLISYLLAYYPSIFHIKNLKIALLIIGSTILAGTIYIDAVYYDIFFKKVIFNSLTHLAFFCLLIAIYTSDFSRFFPMRVVAYYSYNWYLWHFMFIDVTTDLIGNGIFAFVVYVIFTFSIAMITTIFIEEKFLEWRDALMKKYFDKSNLNSSA